MEENLANLFLCIYNPYKDIKKESLPDRIILESISSSDANNSYEIVFTPLH